MGMAAGQARLLSITSRMSDNELRAQIINNNKMRLAAESSQASEAYVAALNEAQLMFSNYDANNNATYQNLTYNALTSFNPYNNQYALINSSGNVLLSERDAENYRASGGNLNAFLSKYGLDYTTTYFDGLQQYMAVGTDGKYSLPYSTGEVNNDGNAIFAAAQFDGVDTAQKLSDYLQKLYDGEADSDHIGYDKSVSSGVYYDFMKYSTQLSEAHDVYYAAVHELKENQYKNLKVNNKNLEAFISELDEMSDLAAIQAFIKVKETDSDSDSDLITYIGEYYKKCSTTGQEYVQELLKGLQDYRSSTVTTPSGKEIDDNGKISIGNNSGFKIDPNGNVSYYYRALPKSITYNATKTKTENNVTKTYVDTSSRILKYTDANGDCYVVDYKYGNEKDKKDKNAYATIYKDTNQNGVLDESEKTDANKIKTFNAIATEVEENQTEEDAAYKAVYSLVSQYVKSGIEKTEELSKTNGEYSIKVLGNVQKESSATVNNNYYCGSNINTYLSTIVDEKEKAEIESEIVTYVLSNVDLTAKTCTLATTTENSASVAKQGVQEVLNKLKLNYQNWWIDPEVKDAPAAFTTAKNNYEAIGKKFAKFLFGAEDAVDFNNYMEMLNIDWVFAKFGDDTAKKTQFTPVQDVILLDSIMNTYGEPNYAWIDVSAPGATPSSYNTNGQAKAQWYENLFNRIKSGGYQVLQDGLASSSEWIQFAFESGIVTMEQVDTLKNWQPLIYSNCSDITSQTNEKMIAKAEAEYRNAMNKIENKDKRYDLELKNIDTEHNSLMTEYESIKTAIDKNVERTFKLYS